MNTYPSFHQSLLDTTTVTGDTTTTATAIITTYRVQAPPPKSVHPNALPNVSSFIFRFILLSLFATVAIWANHEASKGFSITIVNDAGKYSSQGKRFSLLYESNDKATRIVLNTSSFVENLLYPNQDLQHTKKQIDSVTLRLATIHFPAIVSVSSPKPHEYIIMLSPSLMEASYNNDDFVLAVLQGMARVWLRDGKGAAPPPLLDGMVEYISSLAGFRSKQVWKSGGGATMSPENDGICWKDDDPRKVAGFLRYYDQRKQPGGGGGEVIRRLNDGMRHGWHDGMMDDALGMSCEHACASYGMFTRLHHPSSSI